MNNVLDKAKKIRLLILDVDGVLTNGTIYYANEQIELKGFHIHDGLGMKLLKQAGIEVAIISAKRSEAVIKRLKDLKINYYYLGEENKLKPYTELKNQLNIEDEQIAYMGDDLPDLCVLRKVGLAISVPEASSFIREQVHYVTSRAAGNGAVREICEIILQSQDRLQDMINSYLL